MKITTSHCRTRRYCQAVELHVADVDYGSADDLCTARLGRPNDLSLAFSFLLNVFFPSLFLFCPLYLLGCGSRHTAGAQLSLLAACLQSEAEAMFLPAPALTTIGFPVYVSMQLELLLNTLILTTSPRLPVSQSQ